jgi:twitching motility protein PilT
VPEVASSYLFDVIRAARKDRASDIHIVAGEGVAMRIDGKIVRRSDQLVRPEDIRSFVEATLDRAGIDRLNTIGTADAAYVDDLAGPIRIHAYREKRGIRLSLRLLATSVPTLESLMLPKAIGEFAERNTGLVLFTGPTGSGKSTAQAALINEINTKREFHIVTLEDPIEYHHESVKSTISQCEVGRDVTTFAEGLRGILRADPDVILVGEMRDRETMRAALEAAETGHLVFGTLHTANAEQTIDRLITAFGADEQEAIRTQLAQTLIGLVGLRLVPLRNGTGRRAAVEILVTNDAVRSQIREKKTHMLRNTIVGGSAIGMQTLEKHLLDLVKEGAISMDAALAAADRPSDIQPNAARAVR